MSKSTTKKDPGYVEIFGYSDDCVEIDGAVHDEIGLYDTATFLLFSDGSVVRVAYGENGQGTWSVARIIEGSAKWTHEPATDEDSNYTDRARLIAPGLSLICDAGTFEELPAAPIAVLKPAADLLRELADEMVIDWDGRLPEAIAIAVKHMSPGASS